jgi:predicted 3-demethylubiquinone-9 3-methyltransferase (glyoxalase superfamily)
MWGKLSEGGEEGPCDWLKKKYSLSWQITVPEWDEMFRDKDATKSERAMTAILQMSKPDMQQVQQAFAGR